MFITKWALRLEEDQQKIAQTIFVVMTLASHRFSYLQLFD